MRSTASVSPYRPNQLRAPVAVPASTETPEQKSWAPAVHSPPWVARSWPLLQRSPSLPTAAEPPAAGPPLLSPDGSTPSLSAAKLRKRFSYPGHLRSGIKNLFGTLAELPLLSRLSKGSPVLTHQLCSSRAIRIWAPEECYRNRRNATINATTRASAPMTYLFAEIHDGESARPLLNAKPGAAFCTKLAAAAGAADASFSGAATFVLGSAGYPAFCRVCENWDSGTAGDGTGFLAGAAATAEDILGANCA